MSTPVFTPPEKIEDIYAATGGKKCCYSIEILADGEIYLLLGNKWGAINAPTAGARVQQDLPVGDASFQLYSLATPNGWKIGILLEELGIDYDAHCMLLSMDRISLC